MKWGVTVQNGVAKNWREGREAEHKGDKTECPERKGLLAGTVRKAEWTEGKEKRGQWRILNPSMAFEYWSSLCSIDLRTPYAFIVNPSSVKSSELPLVALVSIPRLPTPSPPHPASFIPERSLLPLSLLERCSSVSFALPSLLSFWWLIHLEPAFGVTPPKWSGPPEQATQSWPLLPQFWDHPRGRTGSALPRRPDDWQQPWVKCPAGRLERGLCPVRGPHSILLSLLPFSGKGALLPLSSLQAHAINSTKMVSTWGRWTDLEKKFSQKVRLSSSGKRILPGVGQWCRRGAHRLPISQSVGLKKKS